MTTVSHIKKGLRPQQRLRRQETFQTIVRKGKRASGAYLTLWCYPKEGLAENTPFLGKPLFGVVVGKHVQRRATKRNVLKRRIKEALRQRQFQFKNDLAILVKAKKADELPSFPVVEKEIVGLCKKTKALL